MGKRKNRSKRSLSSLPRGLPVRGVVGSKNGEPTSNPFEVAHRQKRPKLEVHNRHVPGLVSQTNSSNRPSALLRALQLRRSHLRSELESRKKANVFSDRRIGEYSREMTAEEQNMARLVRERSQQSKRAGRYRLDDDDNDDDGDGGGSLSNLTHKGRRIGSAENPRECHDDLDLLSDDDEDDVGNLDAADTAMHFGGGGGNRGGPAASDSYYGSSDPTSGNALSSQYASRKTELDDLILRRKLLKAEKLKSKQEQVDAVERMDASFADLSAALSFRDKEEEHRRHMESKRAGTLSKDDAEMAEWDAETRQYQFQQHRRVRATDRTKTAEEMAREEADRLRELERRRLARMNGDFDDDDFSDVLESGSEDEDEGQQGKKRRKRYRRSNDRNHPEALDNDSDEDEDEDEIQTRFTGDGLIRVDKHGRVVPDEEEKEQEEDCSHDEERDEEDSDSSLSPLAVGTRIRASYRATEQFDETEAWYDGVIKAVHDDNDQKRVSYDVEYDDGDFEEGVQRRHIRLLSSEAKKGPKKKKQEEIDGPTEHKLRLQRKAKEKARSDMPFVLEVPTTLEAFHDMVAAHAKTGDDVGVLVRRIHATHSVRLDGRNASVMQNFYDVLLRRMVAVGDAAHDAGDGGSELGRYRQLSALTETLYRMAQDAPDAAAAVWGRRLAVLWAAHDKRLRDAPLVAPVPEGDDGDIGKGEVDKDATWPSTGVFYLLRCLGHIFPVTDKRHSVVTPALLYLGHVLAHTPVRTEYGLVMGTVFSGLLLEYTRQAGRIAPEAMAFLSGVLRLYAAPGNIKKKKVDRRNEEPRPFALPSLQAAAALDRFRSLRERASRYKPTAGRGREEEGKASALPPLRLERAALHNEKYNTTMPVALLAAVLQLIESAANHLAGQLGSAEREFFADVTDSLLLLHVDNVDSNDEPKRKKKLRKQKSERKAGSLLLPAALRQKVASAAAAVAAACGLQQGRQDAEPSRRLPLRRRSGPSTRERAVPSLAPRLEPTDKYSMSRDKGKSAARAAADRTRREYRREHKAASRELRLDAAFVETERRREQDQKDATARAKRQRAFAWLESEQAAMNQQVRQGGGLLKGGGTGAARAKAATAKLGIKKGGKF